MKLLNNARALYKALIARLVTLEALGSSHYKKFRKHCLKSHRAVVMHYTALPEHQKKRALHIAGLVGLLLIFSLFKGCQLLASNRVNVPTVPMMVRFGNHIKIPKESALRTEIIIKTVSLSGAPHEVSFPGVIEALPSRTVNILPPLTGRLIKLNTQLGAFVKKNQVLAVISSPDLAQAYSNNEKAIGQLNLTTEALKRAKSVNRIGGNAVKDVQMAQNDYLQARAEAKRAEKQLKILDNKGHGKLTIKAPIAGRVTALNYGLGSYITDPTNTLMSISNLKTVWVTVSIPENYIGMMKQKQRVSVALSAYPDKILHGKIAFISAVLDPVTRRNQTRIILSNSDGKLQPNMFAMVTLFVPQPTVVMVPITAVLMNDDTTSVYVEKAPWIFERQAVELGFEDGNEVRILSGLKAGDRIASCGGIFIND